MLWNKVTVNCKKNYDNDLRFTIIMTRKVTPFMG